MARFPWQKKKAEIEVGRPTGGQSGYQIAPDHGLFAADPGAYLATHACELAGAMKSIGGVDPTSICFDTAQATTRGASYLPVAKMRLGARICVHPTVPVLKLLQIEQTDQGKPFAYLPWQEDGCTALLLPDTADYALTGPLSGCHVYVATSVNKAPMLFHANANKSGDNLTANMATKDNDAINLASKYGYVIKKRLARGEYDGFAFVWGRRVNGHSWSFYVHQASPDGKFSNWPLYTV